MKGIHPNLSQAAALSAVVSLLCAMGCRNQPGGVGNPFLAPDRVPPPATRALLPGQAQPYYPGDPLPTMQSQAETQGSIPATGGLAWNAPGGADPQASDQQPSSALAFSNEPTVAVPSDGEELRFPLPKPLEPEPATPIAAPASDASHAIQLAAVPANQAVVPASYNAPMASPADPTNGVAEIAAEPAATGPWRSPQIAQPISVVYGAVPMFPGVGPVVPHVHSMDVRLRAVPSPPPEPLQPSTPRIRLPGYAPAQPLTDVPLTSIGGLQTVQVSPLPPPPYDSAVNLAVLPESASGGDGFRPRSSMR